MERTQPYAYGLDETAWQLGGMHRSTLERHIRSGRIRAIKIGRRVLVTRAEIERVLGLDASEIAFDRAPPGPMAER